MTNNHRSFEALSAFVPDDGMSWSLRLSLLLLTVLLVSTITFTTTKRAYRKSLDSEGGPTTIPVVPYYVPFFGHLAGLVRSPYLFITSTL